MMPFLDKYAQTHDPRWLAAEGMVLLALFALGVTLFVLAIHNEQHAVISLMVTGGCIGVAIARIKYVVHYSRRNDPHDPRVT